MKLSIGVIHRKFAAHLLALCFHIGHNVVVTIALEVDVLYFAFHLALLKFALPYNCLHIGIDGKRAYQILARQEFSQLKVLREHLATNVLITLSHQLTVEGDFA